MTKNDSENDLTEEPLLHHLIELRHRLILSLIAVIIGFFVSYAFAPEIYFILVQPLAAIMEEPKLIYTTLTEPFVTYIKLSLWAGCLLAMPFILTQIWFFIAPALYKTERKTFIIFLIATPVLFAAGAALAYFVVFPLAWKFLLSFDGSLSISDAPIALQLEPKISEYLSLATSLILAFGLAFQLPVLIMLLAKVGLVTAEKLKAFRRYAIVIITIAAAVITPPDVISMLLLAVPLYLLYELSIFGTKFVK
ncbi:MAG: twin-arginine translocase subunit TatC [Alphaproteobacteria bacterium]|nr:twin-arginine translocase subunit TatC [Alphaproteobacteria bacterium]